ncbi:hypothetical protein KP79_PYT05526 [Mizuhopecten yessoensis]|uniref:Endonuclease/exonuclease/phosphatase domain-containing protein n=1 Tax=Mizuhopecten yessoensis TaxID=6573 RepID=A0A210QWE3_MIZYE|nr:hypothetical protein KP79_PYT05526 [Mizuhopecten yessoensis]
MAMSHPVNLSNDGSTIRTTKRNQKEEKVTETAAAGIHTSNAIQYVDFPIHVISMNVSGGSDGLGTATRRTKLIADVVISNEPGIVLFQEFKWQGIKGRAWKDTPLPGHYVYTGHSEASIMYDTRRFQLTELPQTQLQATLDEMKRKGEVSQDFTPLARSCVRLLETTGQDQLKVLVVSWHGFYKGVNEPKREEQFEDLQIYLKKLSEREHAAILLGGDFNIEMSLIISSVLPELILYGYTPSERREGKNIDYFMTSPELTLADVGYIDLTRTNDANPYRLLDHDPISAQVDRRKALEKVIPLPKTFASREIEASERAS